jgi:hypothetical protein
MFLKNVSNHPDRTVSQLSESRTEILYRFAAMQWTHGQFDPPSFPPHFQQIQQNAAGNQRTRIPSITQWSVTPCSLVDMQ